jgi:hypothetical protein
MKGFWIGFAATLVGLAVFGLANLLTSFRYPALMIAWAASYVLAMVAAIVLAVRRKSRLAAAMFSGMAASVIVLMATCFAAVLRNP